MNIASNGRLALRATAGAPPAEKILRCRKILIDLENHPEETSIRVIQDLRMVLRSVQKSETANAEQITQSGDLLLRLKKIDPRRLKRIANQNDEDEPVAVTEPNNLSGHRPPADGYAPRVLTEQFWADLAARCR